ncbi:Alpha-2-Macroglobulin [Mactra antiquata]
MRGCLVLGFLALWINVVTGKHLFSVPTLMEVNSTTQVCLILQDVTADTNWEIIDDETLYTIGIYVDFIRNEFIQTEMVDVVTSSIDDLHKCFEIPTPSRTGTFSTEVHVRTNHPAFQNDTVIVSYNQSVEVRSVSHITLVQTDKPIYKPGETVKFRVLTMDYRLQQQLISYNLIKIETPNGFRVKEWKDVTTESGVVSLEMPLSSDPPLGIWQISVSTSDESWFTAQTFTVDEYVLPKFEVTVKPPSYLFPTSKHIEMEICAKYTYGKPVKGSATVDICYKPKYNYDDGRPCDHKHIEIDGCYKLVTDAEELQLKNKSYHLYGDLVITVNVTEKETGVILTGSSTGPMMTLDSLNIKIEDDSNNQYKPGFPYNARIIVTEPDGSPAPGETIKVTATNHRSKYLWNNTFITDDDGMVYFSLIDPVKGLGNIRIYVKATANKDDWRYSYIDGFHPYRMYPPSSYHSITEWYSASDNFIYVPDIDVPGNCGDNLPVDVYYTFEPDTDYTFLSMIRAGDNIVDSDKTVIKASDIASILNVPADNKYEPLQKGVKESPPPEEDLYPIPMPFGATLERKQSSPSVEEEYKSYSKARFTLNVPIYEEYSPYFKLFIMYMRTDGEVIASTLQINVNGCFRNKVNYKFDESSVRPGDDLNYKIKASAGSTCFVGMVDKSVMLLGGSNQVTPKQVFDKVSQVSRQYFYQYTGGDDRKYCNLYFERVGDDPLYPSDYFRGRPIGKDSMTAFKDAYLGVSTDGIVQTRPCERAPIYLYARMDGLPGMDGSVGNRGPIALVNSIMPDSAQVEKQVLSEPDSVERIRSFFPETWLWDIVILGEDEEEKTVVTTMPDTITEWVGNTLCTNPKDGVGISDITGVTGFQPFFVSLTLPYSAIRGEILPIVVTVFNYLQECVPMQLDFKQTDGFEFREGGSLGKQFCLCGGNTESVKFYIIPTVVGEIDIEVTAVSIENYGLCTDVIVSDLKTGTSDGVQRQLLIEAEGKPEEYTWSSYTCHKGDDVNVDVINWNKPEDLVPDSYRAKVAVVGDIMGPTLSNLKNLLRMPYGCGEQNMASWAPNIYVLQYLKNTLQSSSKIEEEAKNYMSVGYQRQMKYRHADNSYSAWGENQYNNATGSLWLTAFVVKSMAQSSEFITIDRKDLIASATFLVEHQDELGCFPSYGKVFSSYMKGGLSDGENIAGLTAFTLIAILEADLGDEFKPAIMSAYECLDITDIVSTDTYTLSLMSYAYSLDFSTDVNSRWVEVMNELENRKIVSEGMTHWKREDTKEIEDESYFWYRAPSAEVEMTSYVLLSSLNVPSRGVNSESTTIVQWLSKQRNSYGGFSSTQDTVVALQALAKYGAATYTEGGNNLNIEIKNKYNDEVLQVNEDNKLVRQTVELARAEDEEMVEITTSGTGCVLTQVNMKYNVYKEVDSGPAFDVKVSVFRSKSDKNNCAMRSISICTSYRKGGVSNMAIVEVKMPTGWIPVKNSLRELEKSGDVQKMEVDKNYVELYFDEFTATRSCVMFEVEQYIRMDPKPALIKVYDYYETSYSVTREYSIKTTCGTKEEIPLDNEGLDCLYTQCRVIDIPPLEVSCPECPETKPEKADLTDIACNSGAVYKAIVGREGDYSIKIKSNIRNKKKDTFRDFFANYNIDDQCSCPILSSEETRAFIFTSSEDLSIDDDTRVITLKEGDTVLKNEKGMERTIRMLATRQNLCKKYTRIRRSGSRQSLSKLKKFMKKYF